YGFKAPDAVRPFVPLLLAADGNFYGATYSGGAAERGTIFRAAPDGTVTVLHSFTGSASYNGFPSGDGAYPAGALIQETDENFYGTTTGGEMSNAGTVFNLTPAGVINVLHAFANSPSDGAYPLVPRIQATDGNLYGTTTAGGPSGVVTTFKITLSGTFTMLHGFSASADGSTLWASLLQAPDGNFYGTALYGGAN